MIGMSSSPATNSITGSGSQPWVLVSAPTCRCARSSSGITADACRPSGYCATIAFAALRLASVHAKPDQRARWSASSRMDAWPAINGSVPRRKPGPRAARQRCFRSALDPRLRRETAGGASPVDLPEYDVDRAQHRGGVGEHVALHHEIHRLQMRKTGRPDLAAVGPVGAVGDEINAELALGA